MDKGKRWELAQRESNKKDKTKLTPLPVDPWKLYCKVRPIMLARFVFALLSFRTHKFPAKSETWESGKLSWNAPCVASADVISEDFWNIKKWYLKIMSESTYQWYFGWLCHLRGDKWSPDQSFFLLGPNFSHFGIFVPRSTRFLNILLALDQKWKIWALVMECK